jgi:hypothetical protein
MLWLFGSQNSNLVVLIMKAQNRFKKFVTSTALALAIGSGGSIVAFAPSAHAAGTVPADVKKGVEDSIATVEALSGLAIAALTVALVPLGAMLTLRFLNMVLSRV